MHSLVFAQSPGSITISTITEELSTLPYSDHVMRMHEVSHLGWQRILAKMSVSQVLFIFLVSLASIVLVQSQFCLKVTSGVVQWPLKHWFSHLKEEKKEGYITPCSSFEHL